VTKGRLCSNGERGGSERERKNLFGFAKRESRNICIAERRCKVAEETMGNKI